MPKTALYRYLWDISSGSNKQLAQKDFRDFLRELFFLEALPLETELIELCGK